MAVKKLSDLMNTLKSHFAWLDLWTESSGRGNIFRPILEELTLLQRICSCLEIFFLQDSSFSSSGRNKSWDLISLESFLSSIGVAIERKSREIYYTIQEIEGGRLDCDGNVLSALVLCFNRVVPTLKCLFNKAVDIFMEYNNNINIPCTCNVVEILGFIQQVFDDVKDIHLLRLELQLDNKLQPLKNVISFASSVGVGQGKFHDLLDYAKDRAITAAYCSYLILRPEITDETTRLSVYSKYSELQKVKIDFRGSFIELLKESRKTRNCKRMDNDSVGAFIESLLENYWKLLAIRPGLVVSTIKILIEELRFMRNVIVNHQRPRQEGFDLDKKMIDLVVDAVCEAGIVLYSHSWKSLRGDSIKEVKLRLSNLMEKVELFKKYSAKSYPETSRYKFPTTYELGFMNGLVKDLKELLSFRPNSSILFAHGQMDVVIEDLEFLRKFLHDMEKLGSQHAEEEFKALQFQVVHMAYKVEFVINSLMVVAGGGDPSPDCNISTSFNAIKEEIKNIKIEVEKKMKKGYCQIDTKNREKISFSNQYPSRSSNPSMDEIIVGFEDEAEKIIYRLKSNSSSLDIVSIVGMPGQGKTTLAKKVYNDSSIRSHFLVHSWCCISQGYQKRKLLLDILGGTTDNDKTVTPAIHHQFKEMEDEDLEQVLYKSLKGRRYLIVLDDIWDIEAWNGLKLCFPNEKNRSRILLTSRIRSVPLQLQQDGYGIANGKPHSLRLLNEDESRELLKIKLFGGDNGIYPRKLLDVGEEITRSCQGLPLALVAAAGILATMEEDRWRSFAKDLSLALVSGTDQCMDLLGMSYLNLPNYLKPCLLYFGSFLQDEIIPVSRLISLWIAEGFVQKTDHDHDHEQQKSLENVAMEYLLDLSNRSLVNVTKRTSKHGIKACSVHDLVHQFCVTKSKEENFLQRLNLSTDKPYLLLEPRRLCIFSSEGLQCFRHVRSLKLFDSTHNRRSYIHFSSISERFKLVKVLDLRGVTYSSFPDDAVMLVHLRFLALDGYISFIPSTIVKLRNLETLLLRTFLKEVSFPADTFLNLSKLRHLKVKPRVIFKFDLNTIFSEKKQMTNLENLSTMVLARKEDMETKIIKNMTNLRKLKCRCIVISDDDEFQDFHFQFPRLDFLSKLESLNISCSSSSSSSSSTTATTGTGNINSSKVELLSMISFPMNNVKKLTLSNFYQPWKSVSKLSKLLPNLEIMELLNRACEGKTWDMEEEEEEEVRFGKLRFLELEDLDIVEWINGYNNNFPCLRHLVLHKCEGLREIEVEFPSLEVVEVKRCHPSVTNWAQSLREDLEDLKIFIDASDFDYKKSKISFLWRNS